MLVIRHGQSQFNAAMDLTGKDPGIIDPSITEKGRLQAQRAATRIRDRKIHTVIASPFTRAIETASIIAESCGSPLVIEPLLREHAWFSCDIGRPRSHLQAAWPHLAFDHLPESWWHQGKEEHESVRDRVRHFLAGLRDRSDHDGLAVVSHWGFILALTGHDVANAGILELDPAAPREARLLAA